MVNNGVSYVVRLKNNLSNNYEVLGLGGYFIEENCYGAGAAILNFQKQIIASVIAKKGKFGWSSLNKY